MINYTLHQLRVFIKVVETQSITKASEELHLTQPAVSLQLKKFQQQFDLPLTEIIGRKVYITDFGREIARIAVDVIRRGDLIEERMLAYQGKLTGKLQFSIVSTAKYVMPFFLDEFLNKHEHIDLIMDVTNKSRVVDSLENNEVDFSMVSVLPEKVAVDHIQLLQNKLYLLGNRRLASRISKAGDVFNLDMPLIFREQGSATRAAMEHYLKRKDIRFRKTIELTSNEAVKQAVIAGLGLSIMPLIGLRNELEKGELVIINQSDLPIITNWHLIWLKGKKFSPVANAFFDYLNQNKEKIIIEKFDWYQNYR